MEHVFVVILALGALITSTQAASIALDFDGFAIVGSPMTGTVVLGTEHTTPVTVTITTGSATITIDGETTKQFIVPVGESSASFVILGSQQLSTTMSATSSHPDLYSDATTSYGVYYGVTIATSAQTVALGETVDVTVTLTTPPAATFYVILTSKLPSSSRMGSWPGTLGQTLRLTFAPAATTTQTTTLTTTAAGTGEVTTTNSPTPTTGEGAKYRFITITVPLTVLRLVNLTLSSATAAVDSDVTVTVTLSTATANGLTVTLSTTLGTFNSGAAVTIANGQSTGTTTLKAQALRGSGQITGAVSGTNAALYIATAKPTTLTLQSKVTIKLSLSTVLAGSTVDVTVELSEAPQTTLTVTLTSAPQLGTFPSGATEVLTFTTGQPQTRTFTASGTAISGDITGVVSGADVALYSNPASVPLAVTAQQQLATVTLSASQSAVPVGSTVIVTVTLSTPATNGVTVTLATTIGSFTDSNIVTISTGTSTTVTITVSESSVGVGKVTGVVAGNDNALFEDVATEATVTVVALETATVSLSPATAPVGSTVIATITLSAPTSNGVTVTLSQVGALGSFTSANPVTIPATGTSATVTITVSAVPVNGIIQGTVSGADVAWYNPVATSAILTVEALRTVTLQVAATTVPAGSTVALTVMLGGITDGGLTVTLSQSKDLLQFGAQQHTVTISPGTAFSTFSLTAASIAETGEITGVVAGTDAAWYEGTFTPVALTVVALRTVTLTLSPATVPVLSSVVVTITLSEPTANGLIVTLSQSTPFGTIANGNTVTIPLGFASATATLSATSVGSGEIRGAISGTDNAWYKATATPASLTVEPLRWVTLTLSESTVVVGSIVDVTVVLSETPASDLTLTMTTTPQLGSFVDGPALTFTNLDTERVTKLTTTAADAGSVSFTLSGTPAPFYTTSQVTLIVLRAVTLSVATSSVYVNKGFAVTVTLSDVPTTDITVTLQSTAGIFTDNGQVTFGPMDTTSKSIVLTVPTIGTTIVTATIGGTAASLYTTAITPVTLNVLALNYVTLSLPVGNVDATGPWVRVDSTATLTVALERSLNDGETLSAQLSYGDGGNEVTFSPNPVLFVAGEASKQVTVSGVTAHGTSNVAVTILNGPVDFQPQSPISLRVCSGTFSCPDGTCSTTGSLTGCACTAHAAITNDNIVSDPVATTGTTMKELIASAPITLTASATYRRGDSGACSNFDFAPYMTIQWSLVPQQTALIDSIVSNRTTIVFPAKHFTPDTVYKLRATLTPLIGTPVTVDFEFKAVPPVPAVAMKAQYRKVSPRNVQLLATIVDPYADPSAATWTCTGICGTALLQALSTNVTITGVFLSGPLDAGMSYITLTYKGVTSGILELEVSETEIPIVTLVPSVQPAVLPMTYLYTQPLVLAATVKYSSGTTLSWIVNGEPMEETSKLFTVPMELLYPEEENTITAIATGLSDGVEVYGEYRFTFVLAAEQSVTITRITNVNSAWDPLTVGVHSAQASYSASSGVVGGTTTFAVGYMDGNTKIVQRTTTDLSSTFVCPIVDATVLRVYVDMLINGHRVATHTLDYPIHIPLADVLARQLTELMSAATSPVDKARVALQAASVMGRGDTEQQSAMLAVVLDGLAAADPTTVDPLTAFEAVKLARQSTGSSEALLNTAVLTLATKYASSATEDNCAAILTELASVPGSANVTKEVGHGLAQGAVLGGPPVKCVGKDAAGRTVILTGRALTLDDLSSEALTVDDATSVSLPNSIGTFASGVSLRLTATLLPPPTVSTTEVASAIVSQGLQLVIWENDVEKTINNLAEPITFWIRSANPQYDDCMYFDEANEEWSSVGVTKIGWSDNSIHCSTTHLTTFGAFMGSHASSASPVHWSLLVVVIASLLQF